MPLTVACVLKSGGIYDALWVARLRAGVAKHLSSAHRFVCLSDVDVPCERIPLEHNWPGWWAKIEAFKLEGPLLYLDLDTAIVGDLSAIAQVATGHGFVVLRDFYRLGDGIGTGIMAWNTAFPAASCHYEFTRHSHYWRNRLGERGDQGFVEEYLVENARLYGGDVVIGRWQDIVGDQIFSYKRHCQGGMSPIDGRWSPPGIPANARVVCLHGRPKFEDMPANDAVRQAWERAA